MNWRAHLRAILAIATLALPTSELIGQSMSTVVVNVVLVLPDYSLRPIPSLDLVLVSEADSMLRRPLHTDLRGTVTHRAPAGRYTLRTVTPVVLDGSEYTWDIGLQLRSGETSSVELTNRNAQVRLSESHTRSRHDPSPTSQGSSFSGQYAITTSGYQILCRKGGGIEYGVAASNLEVSHTPGQGTVFLRLPPPHPVVQGTVTDAGWFSTGEWVVQANRQGVRRNSKNYYRMEGTLTGGRISGRMFHRLTLDLPVFTDDECRGETTFSGVRVEPAG